FLRLVLILLVHLLLGHGHFHFTLSPVRIIRIAAHAVRDESPLVDGGQETVAPKRRTHRRRHVRTEHHVSRQILILRAQTVSQPCTHRRTASLVGPGIHHQAGRLVIRNVGVYRPYPANIVGHFSQVRPQLAHIHAALAV